MKIRFTPASGFATALAVAALATGLLSTQANAANGVDYVALGDSAAAGPLILPVDWSRPDCARSLANYPRVFAEASGASLTDVTCSGAKTVDFTGKQFGWIPAQFDALGDATELVTVTIGGNDVGLVQAALSCFNAFPEPYGTSCAKRMTADGKDELAEKIAAFVPVWTEAFTGIKAKSPNARVFVVGYGTYLPPGGCPDRIPMWDDDSDYIQASVSKMNDGLALAAVRAGATFVDLEPSTVAHTVCEPAGQRYYEPLIPGNPAAPLHPNAAGMANAAQQLAAAAG